MSGMTTGDLPASGAILRAAIRLAELMIIDEEPRRRISALIRAVRTEASAGNNRKERENQ